MKNFIKIWALPALAASVLAFSSCEKALNDATETTDSGQDFAEDMESINSTMDMVQDIGLNQGFMQKNGNPIIPSSVWIYTDTLFSDGDGIEITADFGNRTLCGDGWSRTGAITFKANKPYSEIGSKLEISTPRLVAQQSSKFLGFRIDPIGRGDKFSIERKSATQIDFVGNFSYEAGGDTNLQSDRQVFNGNFSLTQIEGQVTSDTKDDKWELTGSCNMKNHAGKPYDVRITEQLVRNSDPDCSKTFISGKLELQNEGSKSVLKLDFGTGTCDNDVVITLPGGIKKTYTLK